MKDFSSCSGSLCRCLVSASPSEEGAARAAETHHLGGLWYNAAVSVSNPAETPALPRGDEPYGVDVTWIPRPKAGNGKAST